MAAMHSEYEQDRIAYQKLLKTYNKLEIQYENIQVNNVILTLFLSSNWQVC